MLAICVGIYPYPNRGDQVLDSLYNIVVYFLTGLDALLGDEKFEIRCRIIHAGVVLPRVADLQGAQDVLVKHTVYLRNPTWLHIASYKQKY